MTSTSTNPDSDPRRRADELATQYRDALVGDVLPF